MLLTLHTNSVRSLVRPGRGEPTVDLIDLPRMTREEFGLFGLNLTTDLLAGAMRARLEKLREAADKSGCACLVLIEQDALALADANDEKALGALERLERVIRGAQILGCNSIAFKIAGKADEQTLERAVEHLKEAAEKADRQEINLLISPTDGLTAEPERVTSIIKKVGGFRVGTFPDFEVASKTPDPVTYLRRLTPYASAVCAATIQFVEVADGGITPPVTEPTKKPKGKGSKGEPKAEPKAAPGADPQAESGTAPEAPRGLSGLAADLAAFGDAQGAPSAKGKSKPRSGIKSDLVAPLGGPMGEAAPSEEPKGKKSKSKGSSVPPPPKPDPKSEEDADAAEEEELRKLGAEMGLMGEEGWSELEAMLEDIPPPPEHRPYAIEKLVAAVISVGYDGTLAIDYRGKGDITLGILNSRAAIEAAIRGATG